MLLITENIEEVQYITEAREDGKKNVYVEGIYMVAETKNRNGRIYPKLALENAINKYSEAYIATKRAYGELGHPTGPTINLDRVCVMHESLKWDGNNIIGRSKVTSTPFGEIVKGLIEDGASLGMSSRGMGSVEMKNGIMEVKNDFMLATAADVVADPSAPKAFVRGIMENIEWIYDAIQGEWKAQDFVEETKKKFHKSSVTQINEQSIAHFEQFINLLSRK
jgi:hypothetical protein